MLYFKPSLLIDKSISVESEAVDLVSEGCELFTGVRIVKYTKKYKITVPLRLFFLQVTLKIESSFHYYEKN